MPGTIAAANSLPIDCSAVMPNTISAPDGGTSERHPVNVNKTIAAQAKADEMAARFADWLWEDPTRATELHRTYNDRFNAMVARSYDGIELSLPGLARRAVGVQRALKGDLQVEVRARVGLGEAVAAIRDYEQNMSGGKVLITPGRT